MKTDSEHPPVGINTTAAETRNIIETTKKFLADLEKSRQETVEKIRQNREYLKKAEEHLRQIHRANIHKIPE
jgi:hypothetical protein